MENQALVVSGFIGRYRFLSNFFPSSVVVDGIEYRNAEAAFQAQKVESRAEKLRFCALDGAAAKRLGRQVKLRPDWEAVKDAVMLKVVREKFTGSQALAVSLISTGDALLVEENTWGDRYWGVCGGRGQNRLGRILMEVRQLLT